MNVRVLRWALPLFAAAVILACSLLVANTRFIFRHPKAPGVKMRVINDRVVVVGRRVRNKRAPRIELVKNTYDFGVAQPGTSGSHAFVIRNKGKGPLKLSKGKTSCKCAFADLEKGEIPPGGEARIVLGWNTGRKFKFFKQAAEIKTNDPRQRSIYLQVSGRIEIRTAIAPDEVVLPRLEPDRAHESDVVLFSRVWKDIEVRDLHCAVEGATCKVLDASPEQLTENKALSGKVIRVRLAARGPGRFQGLISFSAAFETSPDAPEKFEITVAGNVLRRLSVYGPAIRSDGVVNLGTVDPAVGSKTRLSLKLKDQDLNLGLADILTRPDFLQVELRPESRLTAKGLYPLLLTVPQGAPVGSFQGVKAGFLKLRFKHPRVKELNLKIRLVVTGEGKF